MNKSEKQLARKKLDFICDSNDFICAICGKSPIEKHHINYGLWNIFIPLCYNHHFEIHCKDESIDNQIILHKNFNILLKINKETKIRKGF
jgi:hypothetical protein